ncbi:MAG TPA: hypothetical protein VFZ91_07680 [Allosphingosinicella sp.]
MAEDAGLTVSEAKYDGRNSGYWYIELSRTGRPPRMILWEARDRWMIVQTRGADGVWIGERIMKEVREDTIEEVIARLE